MAHRISLVAVRAETAPYSLFDLSPEAHKAFEDIAIDARGALDEMRTELGVLDRSQGSGEPELAPQPEARDIPQLIATAQDAGARVELISDVPTLDPLTGTTVYRVLQEALTNARRHAPHAVATVNITRQEGVVELNISNPSDHHEWQVGRGWRGCGNALSEAVARFT